MKKVTAVLTVLCLACALVLLGCHAAPTGTIVFEETVSPNEQYVSSEEDIVYYTVRVTQAAPGAVTVSAESNSGFFGPVDDQIAVAVVSVSTGDGGVDERKISFVTRALEMAAEATPGA